MVRQPGCLTPIAMVFVAGCLLIVVGLMTESPRSVRASLACLLATAVLLVAGWWLRQRGWWQ
jgi:hypothetical protein